MKILWCRERNESGKKEEKSASRLLLWSLTREKCRRVHRFPDWHIVSIVSSRIEVNGHTRRFLSLSPSLCSLCVCKVLYIFTLNVLPFLCRESKSLFWASLKGSPPKKKKKNRESVKRTHRLYGLCVCTHTHSPVYSRHSRLSRKIQQREKKNQIDKKRKIGVIKATLLVMAVSPFFAWEKGQKANNKRGPC